MRNSRLKNKYNPENIYQEPAQKYLNSLVRQYIKELKENDPYLSEKYLKIEEEKRREAELERLINSKRINGVYRTRTTKAGNQMSIEIYPSFKFAIDVPREKKKKESSTAQKNLNSKKAQQYLINLINENFGDGDIWSTWTYEDSQLPESVEQAQKDMANFIRRINRRRIKRGQGNLKYIYITEFDKGEDGKSVRIHHHMICSGDVDRDELEKLWKKGKRNQTKRLAGDLDTHLSGLANYITKDPRGKKRWSSSQGLRKPKVTLSYSKFNKKNVNAMIRDNGLIEPLMISKHPGYKYIDAKVMFNKHNQGWYISARMVRKV